MPPLPHTQRLALHPFFCKDSGSSLVFNYQTTFSRTASFHEGCHGLPIGREYCAVNEMQNTVCEDATRIQLEVPQIIIAVPLAEKMNGTYVPIILQRFLKIATFAACI